MRSVGWIRWRRVIGALAGAVIAVAAISATAGGARLAGSGVRTVGAQIERADDDGSGCPPGAGLEGENCVPVGMRVIVITKAGANNSCGAMTVIQVHLQKEFDGYEALFTEPGNPGVGSGWFFNSSTGGPYSGQVFTTTTISYGNITYSVPKGDGAWWVGYGGGPGPCGSPAASSVQGWGITAQPVLSGTVTLGCSSVCAAAGEPVDGIEVHADGPTSASATTSSDGTYSMVVSKGTYHVTASFDGWQFDPAHRRVDVGTRDVGGVDFTGCGQEALSAAAAAAPLDLHGASCNNTVEVTYNAQTGAMTAAWRAIYECNGTAEPSLVVLLIPEDTPVPRALISQDASGISATVPKPGTTMLAMSIHLSKSGRSGSAALEAGGFPVQHAVLGEGLVTCFPVPETLPLH